MTTPDERTRALIFAIEVLRDMKRARDISDEWKRQIEVVLRHYPEPADIQAEAGRIAQMDPSFPWLSPWTDGRKRHPE